MTIIHTDDRLGEKMSNKTNTLSTAEPASTPKNAKTEKNTPKSTKKHSPEYMQNRELSWLKFNERVMDEAKDPTVPLIERLRFLTIFTTNLDEFFMVRVGSLIDMLPLGAEGSDNKTGMTPQEQLDAIYRETRRLYRKRDDLFYRLVSELQGRDIHFLKYDALTPSEQEFCERYFSHEIMPLLIPQIIDKLHPFPQMQNKAVAIGMLLQGTGKKPVPALLSLPSVIPDVLYLPGSGIRVVSTADILYEFADVAFSTYEVLEKVKLCITRNADIHAEDEDLELSSDFRNLMKKMLRDRRHLAPLRLELSHEISADMKKFLVDKLNLTEDQVFCSRAPLKLDFAYPLGDKLNEQQTAELLYTPYEQRIPQTVERGVSMFTQIQEHDLLLSYPYESMDPFLDLLDEASTDDDVVSISITIYRLARKSRLVQALCRAAENRKKVTVLIELRARFDEQNNIDWSEEFEKAGCNIIYGTPNYKVHSKLCLITRKEGKELRTYTQAGTGNYNEKTSKLYTDLCLMTCNPYIGRDALQFFQNMGIANLEGNYRSLIVSPVSLKSTVLRLMDREIAKGRDGFMFFKMNSFTDKEIIEKLRDASRAGVTVKMLIRGITCLVPAVKNETENIEIRSIVGRYLEHSRIYIFGKDDQESMYIASADFMTRNTERRVEVGCPIYSEEVRAKIHTIVALMWADNLKARRLKSDGKYHWIKNAVKAEEMTADAGLIGSSAAEDEELAAAAALEETAAAEEAASTAGGASPNADAADASAEAAAASVPQWLLSMTTPRAENRGVSAQDAQMELAIRTGYLPGEAKKKRNPPANRRILKMLRMLRIPRVPAALRTPEMLRSRTALTLSSRTERRRASSRS